VLLLLVACVGAGKPSESGSDTSDDTSGDTLTPCVPGDPPGAVTREPDNPALTAGLTVDGLTDYTIADPDLSWDDAAGGWSLYFMAAHGTSITGDLRMVIRHATSPDGLTWDLAESPVFAASDDPDAWDYTHSETPSVGFRADAAPDRRYVLAYSGANGDPDGLGFAGYGIGVAVSADGASFERIPADESPTGQAGQVLTWRDVYPDSDAGVVADPEIRYANGQWHLWFSSFGCSDGCSRVDAYGIAHATSDDAVHWTVDDESPLPDLLRSAGAPTTGGGQPSVAFDDATCTWSLWMTSDPSGAAADQDVVLNNALGFYRATSDDGLRWHPDFQTPTLAWDPDAPGEDLGLLTGADVAFHAGQQRLAYVGFTAVDVPAGFYLPVQTWYDAAGYAPGWMVLNGAGD